MEKTSGDTVGKNTPETRSHDLSPEHLNQLYQRLAAHNDADASALSNRQNITPKLLPGTRATTPTPLRFDSRLITPGPVNNGPADNAATSGKPVFAITPNRVASAIDSRTRFSSIPPTPERRPPSTPAPNNHPDDLMAMAPASSTAFHDDATLVAMKHVKLTTPAAAAIASGTAFASFGSPCAGANTASAPTADRYFSNDYFAAPPYPELPAKGVRFWGETRAFREEQQTWQTGQYSYKHEGMLYTAGLNKDWSIDSVLGLTLDYLDSKVTPNRNDDYRENKIRGYRLGGQYHGTYNAKFPFSLEAFYGQIENEGSGYFLSDPDATAHTWSEPKHDSNYFGGKFRVGAPLMWGNEYKLYPEIGLDYQQLASKPYSALITADQDTYNLVTGKITSKSLQMPLSLTIKKDFVNCWGFLTPKLETALIREFYEDTAGSLYSQNAASATPITPQNGFLTPITASPGHSHFYRLGGALEIRTTGGWNLLAHFRHEWTPSWSRNELTLKLTRNF